MRKSRADDSTGFDFRIRTGPVEKRDDGLKLCDQIRRSGHNGCLVIKHNESLWEPLKLEKPAPVPVRVQLASFRTEKGAEKGHEVLKKLLGDKVGELEILVRKSPKGKFNYRIRTAPMKDRKDALALCEAFKAAGHSDCILIQQNDAVWKTAATVSEVEHAADDTPYRVQLASYESRNNAFAARDRLERIIDNHLSPAINTTVEFVINAKRTLYRIFLPDVSTRGEADTLCKEVRAAGHEECLVVSHDSAGTAVAGWL